MSTIRPLPQDVVALIAAGEVIDSLAAVVRELVENALDAQATRLTISLWPEQWRIQVADNGSGMDLENLSQAAAAHSTSKIRDRTDLNRVSSLGFRGEALHSLAQLSDLAICSRCGEQEGWAVTYNQQGQVTAVETVAIAPGTVVTVANLFGSWAARRDALPSIAQQMRAVQQTIQQMALCHPHVTWQVHLRDRSWLNIWPSESALQILPQLIRGVQPSDLRDAVVKVPAQSPAQNPVEHLVENYVEHHDADNVAFSPKSEIETETETEIDTTAAIDEINEINEISEIYALLGLPDRCHRHRPDWIRIALNGRPVQAPELEQAIYRAFRRTLPRDRYPVCFLHLQLPPEQIDWNRHPAKTEIYLHQLPFWQEQVTQAIDHILQLNADSLAETYGMQRVNQLLKTAELDGVYGTRRTVSQSTSEVADVLTHTDGTDNTHIDEDRSPAKFSELTAIAQVHNTYILAEHPSGIWLIEQHIAHERVLYEQLCDRWQIVPLEPPVILPQLEQAQVEQLQRIGLEVDPFGEQLWAVRTAPERLAQREDCAEALIELSLGGDLDAALVATACRTAIRNGMALNSAELQTLLKQWQQTQNPRTCPHGRPIALQLEESSLSRFFRRHWVIGKSHGI
ncbi:MAG: DNA mismatch repair endonuclease MutL [Thainema sp.]